MKYLFTAVLVVVLIVPFTGCASAPTAEGIASADYGASILQTEAESKAKEWLHGRLFDPESARYEWEQVVRGWTRDAPAQGGRTHYGYKLSGRINAKNRLGGYVGYKPYIFLFHDGQIERIYTSQDLRGVGLGKVTTGVAP